MAEGDVTPTNETSKGKGSFLKKNKTAMIGAAILLGVVMLYLLSHRSSAAATTSDQTAASGGIDPNTGYLYGTPADLAASGSSGATTSVPGPAGATGATGATGQPGPPGKPGTPAGHVPTPVKRPVPKPGPRTYKVEAGDNLSKIASKLHIKGGWEALYKTNKSVIGSNPNLIKPGQTLHY